MLSSTTRRALRAQTSSPRRRRGRCRLTGGMEGHRSVSARTGTPPCRRWSSRRRATTSRPGVNSGSMGGPVRAPCLWSWEAKRNYVHTRGSGSTSTSSTRPPPSRTRSTSGACGSGSSTSISRTYGTRLSSGSNSTSSGRSSNDDSYSSSTPTRTLPTTPPQRTTGGHEGVTEKRALCVVPPYIGNEEVVVRVNTCVIKSPPRE